MSWYYDSLTGLQFSCLAINLYDSAAINYLGIGIKR